MEEKTKPNRRQSRNDKNNKNNNDKADELGEEEAVLRTTTKAALISGRNAERKKKFTSVEATTTTNGGDNAADAGTAPEPGGKLRMSSRSGRPKTETQSPTTSGHHSSVISTEVTGANPPIHHEAASEMLDIIDRNDEAEADDVGDQGNEPPAITVRQPGAFFVPGPGFNNNNNNEAGSDADNEFLDVDDDGDDDDDEETSGEVSKMPVALLLGDGAEFDRNESRHTVVEKIRRETRNKLRQSVTIVAQEDAGAIRRHRRHQLLALGLVLVAVCAILFGVLLGPKNKTRNRSSMVTTNQVCWNAMGPIRPGSSTEGTLDGIGSARQPIVVAMQKACGDGSHVPVFDNGRWYQFMGEGGWVKAFTCNDDVLDTQMDTQINVFAGDCENLNCIKLNDDYCGSQSLVSWFAVKEEMYYILVDGKESSSVGSFVVHVENGEDNDECMTAKGPLEIGSTTHVSSEMIQRATAPSSTAPLPPSPPACGPASLDYGLWYTVRGTGKGLRVSTCHNETTVGTHIAVYEGSSTNDGCSSLQCKVGWSDKTSPDACPFINEASTVSWRSVLDNVYYIRVGVGVPSASGAGDGFRLTLDEFEPTHDICEEAVSITPMSNGTFTFGTTANATRMNSLPLCDRNMSSAGVWYRFIGNGGILRVSVCDTASASAFLFENSCDELACVDLYAGSTTCSLLWLSQESTEYFLMITVDSNQDEFAFTLEDFPVAANDRCAGAIDLVPDESHVTVASTLNARLNDNIISAKSDMSVLGIDRCDLFGYWMPRFVPGLWYRVRGTGKLFEVSTYSQFTTYDTVIAVAKGDCNRLTCIKAEDEDSRSNSMLPTTLMFETIVDETYYILVSGWSDIAYRDAEYPDMDDALKLLNAYRKGTTPVGTFGLSIREKSGFTNDQCKLAEYVVPALGQIIFGSTANSTVAEVSNCALPTPFPDTGSWYKVKGTGSTIRTLLPLFMADFPAAVSVYGGECGNLQCIGDYRALKVGLTTAYGCVEWHSEPGETYYVFVAGVRTSGNFALQIVEMEEPALMKDKGCENAALMLLNDPSPTLGSGSDAAKSSEVPNCSGSDAPAGVWYKLQGKTEDGIIISTCSDLQHSDPDIVIYSGDSCDSLSCIWTEKRPCGEGLLGKSLVWNADLTTQYYIMVKAQHNDSFKLQTSTISAPINDSCEKAIELGINDGLIVASTSLGEVELGVDLKWPSCGEGARVSPGLWYKILGSGSRLRVSTCSNATQIDTFIRLFSGSCSGGVTSLICETTNEDDESCGTSSTIVWDSLPGVEYFLLVQGGFFEYGDFGLTFEEVNTNSKLLRSQHLRKLEQSSTSNEILVADNTNDNCTTALEITPSNTRTIYHGSTFSATVQEIPPCPYTTDSPSRGVWFRVVGTGKGFSMSTCHNGTSFDNVFRVYESYNATCGNFSCVGVVNEIEDLEALGLGNGCEYSSSSTRKVKWRSKPGVMYYIVLFGMTEMDRGEYSLSFEEMNLATNDRCEDAQLLDTSMGIRFVNGSTLYATIDAQALICERHDYNFRLNMPGLWYELMLTKGNAFRATTCHAMTDYDTKLLVLHGPDCNALSCIEINDDMSDCGLASQLSWKAIPGERYLLHVHGYYFQHRMGNFGLEVEEFQTPINDDCNDAIMVTPSVELVVGSTANAFGDSSAPFCYLPVGAPSVWYKVKGTGASMRASTCSNETNFNTRLAVFVGNDCEVLSCIEANMSDFASTCSQSAGASTVQWKTEANVLYFIHVFGAPGQSGDYGLLIDEVSAPANDGCMNAFYLDPDQRSEIIGSIQGATEDIFVPDCHLNATKQPGVWYHLNGTGGDIQLSNCEDESNSLDSNISVGIYLGSCSQLECAPASLVFRACDNGIFDVGGYWVASWFLSPGQYYHLLVRGSASYSGELRLNFSRVEAPDNDECSTAEMLTLSGGKAATIGSTYGAYIEEEVSSCNETAGVVRGVWYNLEGNMLSGSTVLASTCSQLTDFQARLTVYSGDCKALSCVATTSNSTSPCGGSTIVEWVVQSSTTYYVLVHGNEIHQSGSFSLNIEEIK